MRGEDKSSLDGRFLIQWRVEKDFHAYFESDVTYKVLVTHVATKKTVETFFRNEYENSQGEQKNGVRAVYFTPDSSSVIAEYEDGPTETFVLPTDPEMLQPEP